MKYCFATVGLVLFSMTVSAQELRTHDQNGDGRPDKWFTLRGGIVLEYKADSNFDGIVDVLVRYGAGDLVTYEEYDFNLDGAMDDFYFYEKGILVRREVDSNFDESVDIWLHLLEGTYISRMEKDSDHDGTVDVVRNYGQSAQ